MHIVGTDHDGEPADASAIEADALDQLDQQDRQQMAGERLADEPVVRLAAYRQHGPQA